MSVFPTGSDPALPDYVRAELRKALPDLKLMADLLAGTRAMHDSAEDYIRKWRDEDLSVYRIRSKSEQLFEGLSRTLSASVGMLFAKPTVVEMGPGEALFEEHWANIDAAGTAGPVFVKHFSEMSIRDGIGLILVDHPSPPLDPETGNPVLVTAEVEQRLSLRPTWAAYPRKNIISWRSEKVNNRQEVTQVVLYEPTKVSEGAYGVETQKNYRVLRLTEEGASWTLVTKVGDNRKAEDFKVIGSGFFRNRNGEVYDRLPIAIAHTGRSDVKMESTIPLLGVAWANLGHYQISTDLRFYLSLSAYPQPTVVGELAKVQGPTGEMTPGQLRVGPMVVVHLEGEGSDYRYTVVPAGSFGPLEKAQKEKKEQIAQLGMSFLVTDTRAAETAEAKRLDATAENATLATAAQGIDDAVNEAWAHHAWYLGIDREDSPMFEINRDFENTAMDPNTMRAYVVAVKDAGLPPRLLLEAWQAGGRIAADMDLDELEMEILAAQAAKEEREREAREAFASQNESTPPDEGEEAP